MADTPLLEVDDVYEASALRWISTGCGKNIVPSHLWNFVTNDFSAREVTSVPQQIIAGPGVLWAYASNLNLWSFFIWFTLLARHLSTCSAGYATYPTWLWLLFFIVLGISLYFEVKSLGYVLIPQLQVTKHFKCLGVSFNLFPFVFWFAALMGLSVFSHLDFATNSLFTATSLATLQSCPAGDDIRYVWDQTVSQAGVLIPGFDTLVYCAWFLMFGQMVFAVCDAVPLLPCAVDYSIGEGNHFTFIYRTVMHARQNHGAALVTLQNTCRMATCTFQAEKFAIGRFFMTLERQELGWEERANHHIRGQLTRGLLMFGLIGIGESGFYLNLQITLAGLNCAVTGSSFFRLEHWQIWLSVVLSVLMAFKRTFDAFFIIRSSTGALYVFKTYLQNTCTPTRDFSKSTQFFANVWRLRLLLYLFTFYIGVVMYAVYKLMAIASCEHSLWNITGGCVQLNGYPSSMSSDRVKAMVNVFGYGMLCALMFVLGFCWFGYLCRFRHLSKEAIQDS
eukprot:TRINITY_DN29523_c0_g4_i1.p1 TRINITY_DN29523_c0_g4~~TRINITY_DN29523_c0_g4_i1.p1  ORF type:complete len:506 (+),score=34.90 TRINITY_DN29523_c0_g4_i1:115-1632(+)